MKIAVVGTGIAGNVAAYHLSRTHAVTVYEASERVGGHTHTHEVSQAGRAYQVDTGFIVFNDWTYPRFIELLRQLGVESQPSSMSFSVHDEPSGLEYNGTSLNGLFAQRRNLFRPTFLRMIREILRFNREAPQLLADTASAAAPSPSDLTLGEYLAANRYSREFVHHYIVPMGAAIWSSDPDGIQRFPARFFVRFFVNHGMLSVDRRPQWRVIRGGSSRYVEKLTAPFRDRIRLNSTVEHVRRLPGGVLVQSRNQPSERYDAIFLACHSDQALRILGDADPREREVLGAIAYRRNEAVLHTDTSVMPANRRAWAAWNYHVADPMHIASNAAGTSVPMLTYNMNILQSLNSATPFLVTLNRRDAIDPAKVIRAMQYEHPIYTPAAVAAQSRHREINGLHQTYFCGAYWRFGFHEDGVVSALDACRHFQDDLETSRVGEQRSTRRAHTGTARA